MYLAFCIVYYPDQPLHNIYINNNFLYHNLTSFVTLQFEDKSPRRRCNASIIVEILMI